MSDFEVQDPDFAARVRASFERQLVMGTIGAELTRIEPGLCEIQLDYRKDLTQQHGYLHAGIATTIADSAGGYAAYSLMPKEASILAVEFKVNLVRPAKGQRFRARGEVLQPGRRLSVCRIQVEAIDGEDVRVCLIGQQTSICLMGESDTPDRGSRNSIG